MASHRKWAHNVPYQPDYTVTKEELLESQNPELVAQVSRLQEQLEAITQDREDLRNSVTELTREVEELEARLTTAESRADRAVKALEEVKMQSKHLMKDGRTKCRICEGLIGFHSVWCPIPQVEAVLAEQEK